ncbi:MAG: hypothetical protein IT223_00045 [Crocinitomicaceae bacterium]|nr:hypothetical protein [Crocinitomicaceae bacterium]
MKITIDNKKTARAVQSEFSEKYPFLKIEFFSRRHKTGSGTEKKFLIDSNRVLGKVNTAGMVTELPVRDDMTVAELEKMFAEKCGLFIQVFRKSGRLWLETTATDQWTLAYQNEQGKELSGVDFSNEKEETDFREQE